MIIIVLVSFNVAAEDLSLCRQGWAQYQYGSYESSVDLFNQCIEKGDLSQATLAQTYRNMGIAANGSSYPEQALKYYDKAIALKPAEVWFDYVNKGNAYSALGEYQLAIESYQKALDAKPHFNEAYYNRGLVYDKMGDTSEAIKNYKLALAHGLNTPNLMERVTHHNIQLTKVSQLTDVAVDTDTNQYQPPQAINQVFRLDSYTCQSFVGRSFKPHPNESLVKNDKTYTFTEHNIKFKLPQLALSKYVVADHLNNTERNVKDSYLVFTNDLTGNISAAVVVTEFPSHLKDQATLMQFTKHVEGGLARAFNPKEILVRELSSDYGTVIELMAYNRGSSPCFPTSEFKKSSPDQETMGISRFVYKGNITIELALIVEQPKHITAEKFTEYARKKMDQFWSGLNIN